jgi:hypothetical protein
MPSKYKNSWMKPSSALTLSLKLKTSIHHFLWNWSRSGPNNNGQKTFRFRPLKSWTQWLSEGSRSQKK